MLLKFITGNTNKFYEAQLVLGEQAIEQLDLDLPEIQSDDAMVIIEAKLYAAAKKHPGPLVVEDASLHLNAMNGFPGPLIKWLLKSIHPEGIYKTVAGLGNAAAIHKVIYGYYYNGAIKYFTGETRGKIVHPIGDLDFGFGPAFRPDGSEKTYGQMTKEEKAPYSARVKALVQLKDFLDNGDKTE